MEKSVMFCIVYISCSLDISTMIIIRVKLIVASLVVWGPFCDSYSKPTVAVLHSPAEYTSTPHGGVFSSNY
jgi:hypothetical protein